MAFSYVVQALMAKPLSFWLPGMEERRDAYVFTTSMPIGVQLSDVSTVMMTARDGRRTLVVSNDRACSCSGGARVCFEFPLPGNAVTERSRWRVKVYRKDGLVKVTVPKC